MQRQPLFATAPPPATPTRPRSLLRVVAWVMLGLVVVLAVLVALGGQPLWSRATAWGLDPLPRPLPSQALEAALETLEQGEFEAARAGLATELEQDLFTWMAIEQRSGAVPAALAARLGQARPSWPGGTTRLVAALGEDPDPGAVLNQSDALEASGTRLSDGQALNRAQALRDLGYAERAAQTARELWLSRVLSADQQGQLVEGLGLYLSPADQSARLDFLLAEGEMGALARLEPLVEGEGEAAFIRFLRGQEALAPLTHADHPFLINREVRALIRENRLDAALARLAEGPRGREADAWLWPTRTLLIRSLYRQGRWDAAYGLAVGQALSGTEAAEADMLAGWLALTQLGLPGSALAHYRAAEVHAIGPRTRAKALRGQARALQALGQDPSAALEACAALPMTFNGQLCLDALGQRLDTRFLRVTERPSTEARDLARAARTLRALGHPRDSRRFLAAIRDQAQRPADVLLAARLYESWGFLQGSVAASRSLHALDRFDGATYLPRMNLSAEARQALDPALTHAVIWQESRFQPAARSGAGAAGLMQLMPATAAEEARRLGLASEHSPERLADSDYNTLLGTAYLSRLVARYDEALPLALAAYNAGPTNVNNWLESFGDPRLGTLSPEDWVELIPFRETRLYVQEVLAAMGLYREALARRAIQPDLEALMTGARAL